jgi:glucose/arabinose dehydrogenase
LAALVLSSAASAAPPIRLEPIAMGLDRPVGVVDAADGSDRLFIFTLPGQIWIWDGEKVLDEPFLDLGDGVSCCFGERGMGGLAFHPDYAENGFFYVAYDGPNDTSRVARFRVSGNPNRAERSSQRILMRVAQPFPQHNLGQLAFGPDGYLYINSGDGGSAGDPMNNGQDLGTVLGKILRIDVDSDFPYAVPPDNPFVDTAGAQPEIWAYGIRNAWRFSFDRKTGDLYIGDVGQDGWEEVNFQSASSLGGENYGWRLMEGTACFDPPADCNDGSIGHRWLPVSRAGDADAAPLLPLRRFLYGRDMGGAAERRRLLGGHSAFRQQPAAGLLR